MDFRTKAIGIIGTAGRKTDATKLDGNSFKRICDIAETEIRRICAGNPTLISGGSAWADHIAVHLSLKLELPLKLYIPCQLTTNGEAYEDNGERDFHGNPGGTLNYYHRLFSQKSGIDSIKEIRTAIQKGLATAYVIKDGLFARNTEVARNSDALIALTFGDGENLKDGGTKDTWSKFSEMKPSAERVHVDLNTFQAYGNMPAKREEPKPYIRHV